MASHATVCFWWQQSWIKRAPILQAVNALLLGVWTSCSSTRAELGPGCIRLPARRQHAASVSERSAVHGKHCCG